MRSKINAFLLIGIIGTCVFGAQFAVQYGKTIWGPKDIWWTPMPLTVPLSETANDFKIFLNNELLDNHIERGALFSYDSTGQQYRVAPADIRVGLNNWHKVKAQFLNASLFSAFFLGLSVAFLIAGTAQMIKDKKA
jgi:hypothetical protein